MAVIKNEPRGYTLLELLIVVAILGGVFGLGARMFTQLINFYTVSKARIEIQRDLRVALDSIQRNLRQGKSNTVSIAQEPGNPPYSKIAFVDVTGSLHIIRQDGHRLYHSKDGVSRILTSDLEFIAFTYPQTDVNTVMSISITLKKTTVRGRTTALQMAVSKVRIMN